MISPTIDLSACGGQPVKLALWSWHDFWTGQVSGKPETWFDGGILEVPADGSTWMAVTPSPGYPGTIAINPNIGASYSCVSASNFHVNSKPGCVGTGSGRQHITAALPASAVTSTFQLRFAYSSGVSDQHRRRGRSSAHASRLVHRRHLVHVAMTVLV